MSHLTAPMRSPPGHVAALASVIKAVERVGPAWTRTDVPVESEERPMTSAPAAPAGPGAGAAVCALGVSRFFGDVVAVEDLDMRIGPGDVRGLVGPNGAGKTTVLGMVLGLSGPDRGSLSVLGDRVGGPGSVVPRGVTGFVDSPAFYPHLSGRRNLQLLARLDGVTTDAAVGTALERVGLAELAGAKAGTYSLGMRQRLGLAAALLGRPRLVVLDEPTNGLDPTGRGYVRDILRELAGDGVAVLLSTHQMDDVEALCSAVTVLAGGRVAFDGDLAALRRQAPPPAYRLLASDPGAARAVADLVPGVRVAAAGGGRPVLTVVGREPDVDRYVAELVGSGVAVREFGPLQSPLEALLQELTGQAAAGSGPDVAAPEPTRAGVAS